MPQVHPLGEICSTAHPVKDQAEFKLLPNEKIENAEKKPEKLDYHELPEKYRICLAAFDDNNDGFIETIELINAARMLRYSKQTTRRLYTMLVVLSFVICALVASITGLTWYIVDESKDTEASDATSLLLNRHTKQVLATRTAGKKTHNYPSLDYLLDLSFDDLDALETVSIAVNNATTTTTTKMYKIAGTEKLHAFDGPMVILSALSGEEIHISYHNTTFKAKDGTNAYYMEKDGRIVLSDEQQVKNNVQFGAIVSGAVGQSSARFGDVVTTPSQNFAPVTKTLFDQSKTYDDTPQVCEAFYDPFMQQYSRYKKSGTTLYAKFEYPTISSLQGGSYPMRVPESKCDAITSFRIQKYDENVCTNLGFWPSVGQPGAKSFKAYLMDVYLQPTDVPLTLPECVSPIENGVINADKCTKGWLALDNYPKWRPWNWAGQRDYLGRVYINEAPTNHNTGFTSTTNTTIDTALVSKEMQMSLNCILTETHMGFPDNWRENYWHYANGNAEVVQKWWRAPDKAYKDDDNELICHCLRYNFQGTPNWLGY